MNIEEYRADLVRRRDTLRAMADQYYEKFSSGKRESDRIDWFRCAHKASGIEIALSLLPEPEADTYESLAQRRDEAAELGAHPE